jgi:16S rRNA processing protein RimM
VSRDRIAFWQARRLSDTVAGLVRVVRAATPAARPDIFVGAGRGAPESAAESIVVMGRVVASHGVRGAIKVEPFSEAPDALLAHPTWWIRPPRATAWREGRVNGGRVHGRALIATLAGVETRDDALALRGAEIGVLRGALPRAKKNEIYWADLVGLAYAIASKVLGAVVDVVTHRAHPILRVARPAGSVGGDG